VNGLIIAIGNFRRNLMEATRTASWADRSGAEFSPWDVLSKPFFRLSTSSYLVASMAEMSRAVTIPRAKKKPSVVERRRLSLVIK
jgi:hypothetical protein